MKKQLAALLLSACMIASVALTLSACADSGETGLPGGTQGTGNTVPPGTGGDPDALVHGVPDGVRFDADGERTQINFVVAETDPDTGDRFHLRSIKLDADEVTGNDKVDSAIAERNAVVESNLGVEIKVYEYLENGLGLTATEVYTALSAQTEDYDVIAGLQWADVDLCMDGLLTDLNAIVDESGNKISYLSLDKPWWSHDYVDSLTFGPNRSIYWVTGDLCLRYTGGYYCFFVNEPLYEKDLTHTKSDLLTQKYGEDTEYGPIYDLVARGDWTLDVLTEMIARAYHDDGDDKVNTTDVLGAAMPVFDNVNGMSICAGIEYSEKSGDNVTLLAGSSNTGLITFCNKFYNLISSGYAYNYGGNYRTAFADFAGDHACFISGRLNQAELYLTKMTANYHIVPCPKMDFEQDHYRSSVHDGINLYGISYYSLNKAAAAATLEEMAYYSYRDVRPIYYDQALKSMYTTDKGAAAMIDLMHDSVYTDFVYIWQFSSYLGHEGDAVGSGGIADVLRHVVTTSKPVSYIRKNEGKWSTGLQDLLEKIELLNQG